VTSLLREHFARPESSEGRHMKKHLFAKFDSP
jgi:hypothetical protein